MPSGQPQPPTVRSRPRAGPLRSLPALLVALACLVVPTALAAAPAWVVGGLVLAYEVEPAPADADAGRLTLTLAQATATGWVLRVEDPAGANASYVLGHDGVVLEADGGPFDPLDVGMGAGLWIDADASWEGKSIDFHGHRLAYERTGDHRGASGLVFVGADRAGARVAAVYDEADGFLAAFSWGEDGAWAALDLSSSSFPVPPPGMVASERIVMAVLACVFVGVVFGTDFLLARRRRRRAVELAWPKGYCPGCGAPRASADAACERCAVAAAPAGGASG